MPKNDKPQTLLDVQPHALQAEQTICGIVMIGGEDWILKALTPEHFYDPTYGAIFAGAQRVAAAGREVNILEVANMLEADQRIQAVGGAAFLAELCTVPSTALAPSAVRIIQDKYSKRLAIHLAEKIKTAGYDLQHDVQQLPTMISELGRKIAEIIPRTLDVDKEAIIAELQEVGEKIPTGIAEMDLLFKGGIEPGWMCLIAARPSVGKSAMAATLMANFLKAGYPVSMISLEMSQKQVLTRMLSAYYEIMPEEVVSKAQELVERVQTPYWVHDNSDIGSILQEIYTSPAKVVIIDYFGLITMKSKEDARQRMDDISRMLKRAAMEAGKPIIVLWQLNRDIEKDKVERQPRMSDLHGGGEKDPDIISFLHDPGAKDALGEDAKTIKESMAVTNPIKELEWIVRKNRHGATGYMKLQFIQKKSLMTERAAAFSNAGLIPAPKIIEQKKKSIHPRSPEQSW